MIKSCMDLVYNLWGGLYNGMGLRFISDTFKRVTRRGTNEPVGVKGDGINLRPNPSDGGWS